MIGTSYLMGSRVFTHVSFWIVYYVAFSFLWADDELYYRSFAFEFVLMPVRILSVYLTLYWLMPKYLLQRRLIHFALFYILLLVIGGITQRMFIYFFHEIFFESNPGLILTPRDFIRAMMLINTTVLLLSGIKMYKLWLDENEKNQKPNEELIEVRSEKRIYRVNPSDILYIEGLGNYVTYYLKDRRLISYNSLKQVEDSLPDSFIRIHKSFIINKNRINSYNSENVEIGERILPLGKNIDLSF